MRRLGRPATAGVGASCGASASQVRSTPPRPLDVRLAMTPVPHHQDSTATETKGSRVDERNRRASPATSPTGGCSARRGPSSSAPAAARAPGRWPPTTRTPPPWGWRRPAWPCDRRPARRPPPSGSPPPRPPTWTRPTPPPSTPPCASPSTSAAFDFGGALRSGVGALRAALAAAGTGTTLVVTSDLRDGLPTSADESAGGDGAAAVLVGDDGAGAPVIAEYLGGASVSDEFLDRWRTPGDRRSRTWEERFGETRYVPLGHRGLGGGAQGRRPGRRARSTGSPSPACTAGPCGPLAAQARASADGALADDLAVSRSARRGTAHPGLVLAVHARAGLAGPGGGRGLAWPTGPTSSSSGPPPALSAWSPAASGGRPDRRRRPSSPTASSWPGGAWSPPSRRAVPSPAGSRRRPPGATRTGSSASSAPATAPRRPCTCRRPGSR